MPQHSPSLIFCDRKAFFHVIVHKLLI